MCGIVGVLSKQGTLSYYVRDLFTNMLRMDSVRGEDSTGCFGVTSSGHVDMLKGDTDGYKFTTTKQYGDFKKRIADNYKVVIGHNRKATSGKVNAQNAHPFQERHIMMVHNGAIKNAKGIADTEVDSQAIAHALADHDCVTALGKLDGAYAIVWYDQTDKSISIARNNQRPLFVLEYAHMIVLASEPGLPMWLNAREDRKADKITLLPTEKIWTWNLDSISRGYYEIGYEEYKHWTPPKTTQVSYTSTPRNDPPDPDKVFPKSNVISMPGTNAPFKAGDIIEFEIDDSQAESGAEVLLGHPVIDGEKYEDLVVRTVLKKGEDYRNYFGDGLKPLLWRGKVQHVRNLVGINTVYVHELQRIERIKDVQNTSVDKEEAKKALENGCSRCKNHIALKDVGNSILRKRKDGTWRIVCANCLAHSIKEAQDRKQGLSINAH